MLKYVFSILLFIFVSQPTLVFADDHEDLISGVINAISIDDNGNVEGILLMMNDGDFVNTIFPCKTPWEVLRLYQSSLRSWSMEAQSP